MKILYVEDDQIDIKLVKYELNASAGFEVDVATSCDEARSKLAGVADYDAALVDLRLPDGDGMSLVHEIRERRLPISVVVVTGFGDEDKAVSALKGGADDYVVKSGTHYRELPSILRRSIQDRRLGLSKSNGGFRVLIASHDAATVRLLNDHFKQKASHIRLYTVENSADLRSLAGGKKIPFDVLLIDNSLPGLNLLGFIKEFRSGIGIDSPIVIIADEGNQESAAIALRLGADDYVVKSNSYHIKLPGILESAFQKTRLLREQSALRQSEERYRTLTELISDYAYVLDVRDDGSFSIEWLSETFERMLGYSSAEIVDKGVWQSAVYEPDLPVLREHFRKVGEGKFDVAEYRLVTRPGELRWLRDSAKPAWDPVVNRVAKVYGAAQDMTERMKIDDDIRRSEARFKELADFLPQPVFEIDQSRKISFANLACLEAFGISQDEFEKGRSPLDFIMPGDRKKVADKIERVFDGFAIDPGRYTAIDKSGRGFPVLISASPIVHDSRVVGLRGILVDLTELVAANEALVASESRYRFLLENSADELFMLDENGTFLQVNEAGCERLGYTRDEIIGQNVVKILAPDISARTQDRMKSVFSDVEITFESVHVKKDGTRIPVEVRSKAVVFEGRKVLLSSARDLMERKRAEEAIAQRSKQLTILSSAAVKVNAVLNVSEILRTLVTTGIELVGASAGTVGLIENGVLLFKEYNKDGDFIPIDVRFAPGQGTPGFVVSTKRSRISNDSKHDPLAIRELHDKLGIYNVIDVPIVNREGEVLGAFAIHNSKDGKRFSESDVEMLEGLAASAAVALENARLLTDMTRAEATIRESEEKFRTLVESSLVGVYIIQDGRFAYVNPAMQRIFGHSDEELIALPSFIETVALDDRESVAENFSKLIAGKTESLKFDFGALKKSGKMMRVEIIGSITTYHGRPAVIGTAEDITERKLSEEMLRRSEERYRNLFEESLDTIYLTTPSGKILDINPAGVRMFGFDSRDQMLELESVIGLYEDPVDRQKALAILDAEGLIRDNQVSMKRRDGTRLIVQDSSTLLRDATGRIVAYRGILKDVTDKKKLEEQLLQSQKLESLGQLTSGIAHDFNNVLGGIIGFTELALGKIENSHPVHNYLMRIYGLADRAAKITKQLLAFARRQILMPKVLDLNQLVSDILELLKRLLGEQIQIEFTPGGGLSTILADPSQIEQVILNLAVNAGDAMQSGGLLAINTNNVTLDEFYCRTHVDVKPGEYVQLSMSDTGMGIAPEAIERIFEPFYTTKEIGKGTGLGLSVVHGIIRQHGGAINAYSEVGRGTTFKVYFPAVNQTAEKIPDKHHDMKSLRKGSETILVVEDNEELREFMRMLLTESGYSVLTASEGEEGIAVFGSHSGEIALVISDVVMPRMNGRELKDSLDRKWPGRKFLFISGYTDSTVHRGFVLDDKTDFLQKPFTAFEFSDTVRKILDRRSR